MDGKTDHQGHANRSVEWPGFGDRILFVGQSTSRSLIKIAFIHFFVFVPFKVPGALCYHCGIDQCGTVFTDSILNNHSGITVASSQISNNTVASFRFSGIMMASCHLCDIIVAFYHLYGILVELQGHHVISVASYWYFSGIVASQRHHDDIVASRLSHRRI